MERSLCDACKNIHIEKFFLPQPEGTENTEVAKFEMDSLFKIMKNKSCPLCSIVLTAVLESWTELPLLWGANFDTPTRVELHSCKVLVPLAQMFARAIEVVVFCGGLELRNASFKGTERWRPELRMSADDAELLGIGKAGQGRQVQREFDAELAKDWYSACLEKHDPVCHKPRIVNARPAENLQVINVVDMRIEKASEDCEYAALSYVWGDPKQMVKTDLATQEQFMTTGLHGIQLPKTISDATSVTRSLGLKYLWVDSICIVQDDPLAQSGQIEQMDTIYGMASIVIVAASGIDASSGLPGVDGTAREDLTIYEPVSITFTSSTPQLTHLRVSVSPPPLRYTLETSKWNTRGWTFQEWHLARRLLIFTSIQAYYICGSCSRSEDLCLETVPSVTAVGIMMEQFEASAISHYLPSRFSAYNVHSAWSDYKNMVTNYSPRSLTHSSDVLPAISGLLNNLHHASQNRFLYGLSIGLFHESLFWTPFQSMTGKRRMKPKEDAPLLPSWTWAAWEVGVIYEFADAFESLVKTWKVVGDSGDSILGIPLLGTPQNDHGFPKKVSGLPGMTYNIQNRPDMSVASQALRCGSGHILGPNFIDWMDGPRVLSFSASVAKLELYMVRRLMHYTSTDALLTPAVQLIGTGRLDAERTYEERNIKKEVICVAVAKSKWTVESMNTVGFEAGLFDAFLNVLIVQEISDGESVYFERIGVGQVEENGWELAKPQVMEVLLI